METSMRTLVAVPLLLFLPACGLLGLDDDTVPFSDLPYAEYLRLIEPGTAVFNDDASWAAFWYEHTTVAHEDGSPVSPPEIDFSSKTAVAVFLGSGLSGCGNYVRLVRSVSLDDGVAVVRVERPRKVGGECGMLITPIHLVEFRKAQTVRFAGDVPE
jgi:hypothetical protein